MGDGMGTGVFLVVYRDNCQCCRARHIACLQYRVPQIHLIMILAIFKAPVLLQNAPLFWGFKERV